MIGDDFDRYPPKKEMDLVSKIEAINEAGGRVSGRRQFLMNVIRRHLTNKSDYDHQLQYEKNADYIFPLSHRIWYENAQTTTLREEYERLGEKKFLAQEGVAELIGKVNGDLEYRIGFLDKAVLEASKTYTAQFLKARQCFEKEKYLIFIEAGLIN